jgi:hypothetical protein
MSKARALERHSIHEAGHVVLARSLGVAVTEVSIDADGGVTRFARDLSRDLTEVKIRLAGRAAETLAFASGGGGRRTCRSDRVHAERAAYEITRDLSGVNQLLLATHEEVRGVLSDKWGRRRDHRQSADRPRLAGRQRHRVLGGHKSGGSWEICKERPARAPTLWAGRSTPMIATASPSVEGPSGPGMLFVPFFIPGPEMWPHAKRPRRSGAESPSVCRGCQVSAPWAADSASTPSQRQ